MTSVGEMNVNKLKEYSISQMVKRELLSERNTFIILKLGENLDKSAGVSTKQKNLCCDYDLMSLIEFKSEKIGN